MTAPVLRLTAANRRAARCAVRRPWLARMFDADAREVLATVRGLLETPENQGFELPQAADSARKMAGRDDATNVVPSPDRNTLSEVPG